MHEKIIMTWSTSNLFEFGYGYKNDTYSGTGNDICWVDLQKHLPTHALNRLPKECFIIDLSKDFDGGELFTICGNTLINWWLKIKFQTFNRITAHSEAIFDIIPPTF